MKQFYPKISGSVADVEDNVDLPTIYKILDTSAGIKINKNLKNLLKNKQKKVEKLGKV